MKEYEAYLKHILDEIEYLINHSNDLDYDSFINDETLRRSFVRSIEIIGEAVKNLPSEVRDKESSIPWKQIAGMRDILIHHYFGVNYKMVWDVVKNKAPELKKTVLRILNN